MVLSGANEPSSERGGYTVWIGAGGGGGGSLGGQYAVSDDTVDWPRSEHVAFGVGASWTWLHC